MQLKKQLFGNTLETILRMKISHQNILFINYNEIKNGLKFWSIEINEISQVKSQVRHLPL